MPELTSTVVPSRAPARFGYWLESALFHLVVCVLGLLCIGWSLPAYALSFMLPRHLGTRLGQRMIMHVFRTHLGLMERTGLARLDLSALDGLDREATLVIVANHPSLIDAALITSRLPRVTGIMKADLRANPFLAGGARLARYISNDTCCALVRQGVDELRRGSQLLVFPEGTRTVTAPVNAFKRGFALIAMHASVPLQTVIIESNSEYLSKGWPIFRRPPLPLEYRVRLGKRFTVERDPRHFSAMLEDYFRAELGHPRTDGGACAARQDYVSPTNAAPLRNTA